MVDHTVVADIAADRKVAVVGIVADRKLVAVVGIVVDRKLPAVVGIAAGYTVVAVSIRVAHTGKDMSAGVDTGEKTAPVVYSQLEQVARE